MIRWKDSERDGWSLVLCARSAMNYDYCHLFPKQLSGVRGIDVGFQYRPFSSLLGAEEGEKEKKKI